MNELKQWFLDQNQRDQMLISLGGVAVVLYLLMFMVLRPMYANLDAREKRNLAAQSEQLRVRELASQLLAKQKSANDGGAGQSLNGLLNQTLGQYGLIMENFQPTENTARVRLGSSEFNKVLAWLNEMEIKQGVVIKDLNITTGQAPGTVMLTIQIAWGQ